MGKFDCILFLQIFRIEDKYFGSFILAFIS
jgi:hypothetical protein